MANCVMCGQPLPESHHHKTCSMCYGDLDYGTDGYYREFMENQRRDAEQLEREREEEERAEAEALEREGA